MTELQSLRKDLEAAVKPGHGEVVDRLLDLLERQLKRCDALEKQAARLEAENARLQKRIAELEGRKPPSSGATGGSIDYSLAAEESASQFRPRSRRRTAGGGGAAFR